MGLIYFTNICKLSGRAGGTVTGAMHFWRANRLYINIIFLVNIEMVQQGLPLYNGNPAVYLSAQFVIGLAPAGIARVKNGQDVPHTILI